MKTLARNLGLSAIVVTCLGVVPYFMVTYLSGTWPLIGLGLWATVLIAAWTWIVFNLL